MENSPSSLFKDSIKYGIILGLISIILSVLIYVFDLVTISLWSGAIVGLLTLIVYFIAILILIKNYRDKILGGFLKYGRGLAFGTITGIYAAILIAAYTFLFNEVIDPDYQKNTMEKVSEMTVDYLYKAGLPDDQIEKTIDMMQTKEIPSAMSASLLSIPGNIIFVFIVSLIAAAFAKKKKDPYLSAMEEIEDNDTNNTNS
ncbi:MAG: DUF4199 domain-containing protein [Bacteroidota bacterium]